MSRLLHPPAAALHDAELLFRMFDESPVRTALLSRDGRFFQINQALCTTLGYSREELRILTLMDVGYPDAAEEKEIEEQLRALWDGRTLRWEMDRRCVHKSGELLWLHITARPLRDEAGRPSHALLLFRDASGRKRAELSLRQNEERFRQIADNSRDVFWVLELRHDPSMFVNPAFHEVWGWWPEGGRLSYEAWCRSIHPDDRARVERALKRDRDGEPEHDIEYRIVRPDGAVRHIHDRGAVIRDIHRRAYRVAGVAVDVTDRVVMDRLKDEFISMISHELRTPLTSVHGSLRLIYGGFGGPIPDAMEPLLRMAKEGSERLVRLVSDLLDIEKIERGGLELRLVPTDLVALSGQVIDAMRALGTERGIEIFATYEVEEAFVSADAARLSQVLTHLLSNAAKFSPDGAPVELALARHGLCYRVSVIDYGPGIPPEVEDRIFEKFVQGDSSSTRSYGGAGLGLTIARAIVERHGGQIGFESEPGKGTIFYFDLPAVFVDS